MSKMKELGKKSAGVFILQIIGQVISMLFAVLVGRFIGAEKYGQVLYVLSVFSIIEVFTKFGFSESLIAFLARNDINDRQQKWILRLSIKLSLLFSFSSIVVILMFPKIPLLLLGKKSVSIGLLYLMLLYIPNQTIIALFASVLRAKGAFFQYILVSDVVAKIIQITAVIIFLFLGWSGEYAIVTAYYLGQILSLIYGGFLVLRLGLLSGESEKYDAWIFLKFSFSQLFTAGIAVLNTEIDKYVLGYVIDSSSVAIYSAAVKVASMSTLMLSSVNAVFAPMISNLYFSGNMKELESLYKRSTMWLVVANLYVSGMICAFQDDIMRFFGEEFIAGSVILVIVLLGQLINAGVGSVGYMNSMTGHPQYRMWADTIGLFSNVMLNLILVRDFGILGVGVATAASLAIKNIVNFIFVYRNLHIHPYSKRFIGVGGIFVLGYFLLLMLRNMMNVHYIIRIIVCGVIYSIVYGMLTYSFVCSDNEKVLIKRNVARLKKFS